MELKARPLIKQLVGQSRGNPSGIGVGNTTYRGQTHGPSVVAFGALATYHGQTLSGSVEDRIWITKMNNLHHGPNSSVSAKNPEG